MRQKTTFVALFFLCAGLVVAYVCHRSAESLFGLARINNSPILGDNFPLSALIGAVLGLGTAAALFNIPRTNQLAGEVVDELYKVAWPSSAETRVNTMVVIVTSVVASLILGVFDITFSQLSTLLANTGIHL
jgi:preprotein translocase subunit SecE